MKKILPYIFILLLVVNIFAPFSVGVHNSQPTVMTRNVEAEGIVLKTEGYANDTTATIKVDVTWVDDTSFRTQEGVLAVIKDAATGKVIGTHEVVLKENPTQPQTGFSQVGEAVFTGLTPNTQYLLTATALQTKIAWSDFIVGGPSAALLSSPNVSVSGNPSPEYITIKTNPTGQTTNSAVQGTQKSLNADAIMPVCGVIHGSVAGCVAQIFYYVLFVPSSYLFALTGTFFDFSFNYSVQDTSYRNPFVVQGWGIIRDFCNMFFIFVLLYVAFATILNVHGFNTKTMIVNVVIIGLFINFSLFTAQIMIDASNILARVFYNPETITITQGGIGSGAASVTAKVGPNGEIPLSAALVNKINPQNIIINGMDTVEVTDTVSGQKATSSTASGIGIGTFILITLLATAVNVVGMIVFLSVGMIFIARVIGLWFAMIFSPLAFFSYTIPSMQGLDMVGWKKWWPETLKLSFLAPVFIFFLYLIIQFLQKGLGVFATQGLTGMAFIISIIVPFAFIMVLLMKAKDIAKGMSGSLGQSITNGVAMAGGVALGAATGGAALLGRNTLGRVAERFDKSNFLNDAASGKKGRMAQFLTKDIGIKKLATKTAKGSFDFRQTGAANALSKETGMNLNKGLGVVGLDTKAGLGGYRGVQERKIDKENKFGESLGFDHHQYEELNDLAEKRKGVLAKAEANVAREKANALAARGTDGETAANARYAEAQREVANLKSGNSEGTGLEKKSLADLEKEAERVKTARQKEHELTVKRRSGKIYDIDQTEESVERLRQKAEDETDPRKKRKLETDYHHAREALDHPEQYRDEYGNIKKFGHARADAAQAGAQIGKEFLTGMAKGAVTGMAAGSIIPGVGTVAGLVGGTLAGGIRELVHYSGTSNRHVGEKHDHSHEPKDNYVAPTPSAPSGGHGGGHDDHGGDDHGGDHGGGGHH